MRARKKEGARESECESERGGSEIREIRVLLGNESKTV